MKLTRYWLLLLFALTFCFSMTTYLVPRERQLVGRAETGDILKIVLGDAQRMFANHFYVKADVYFHRGYYPSFIDQGYANKPAHIHIAERHDGKDDHDEEEEHEKGMDFLGKPNNWIDSFSRNFFPSHHSHRDQPGEAREILPWLSLSADLDPHRIDTYTVASYWLRSNLHKSQDAEDFLRQGLRANPDSFEILYELGQIYYEDRHDPVRARNIWELALKRWNEQWDSGVDANWVDYDDIVTHLAHVEKDLGDYPAALSYLEAEQAVSPVPEEIQVQIDEMKQKIATGKK